MVEVLSDHVLQDAGGFGLIRVWGLGFNVRKLDAISMRVIKDIA